MFRLALRQTEGLIGSIMALLGLDMARPGHTTLSRRAETLQVPRPGRRHNAEPLHLLVDSTGLKLCGAGEWLGEKHGTKTRRDWRTLHIGTNADTGKIVEAKLTPTLAGELRRKRRGKAGRSWYVDETHLRVGGRWCYLSRHRKAGALVDVLFSEKRDVRAAKAFFGQPRPSPALRATASPPTGTTATRGRSAVCWTAGCVTGPAATSTTGLNKITGALRADIDPCGLQVSDLSRRFCRGHDELRHFSAPGPVTTSTSPPPAADFATLDDTATVLSILQKV